MQIVNGSFNYGFYRNRIRLLAKAIKGYTDLHAKDPISELDCTARS
jgi:hypothetical protein